MTDTSPATEKFDTQREKIVFRTDSKFELETSSIHPVST